MVDGGGTNTSKKYKNWFAMTDWAGGKVSEEDQKKYLAYSIDSLTIFFAHVRENKARDEYSKSSAKLPFINPQTGQLFWYIPHFGDQKDFNYDERYFFNTDAVRFLAWLDSISNDKSPYKDESSVEKLIRNVFPSQLSNGDLDEAALYITVGKTLGLLGQVQDNVIKLVEAKIAEKPKEEAEEKDAESGKAVETAKVVTTAGGLRGTGQTQTTVGGEPIEEPVAQAPETVDTSRPPLVTDTERERRRMYGYESAWLTSAILHDLCGQHGLAPTPELLNVLRLQVHETIGNYNIEQFEQMFANPAERIKAYRNLQTKLATDNASFQVAYHNLIDTHLKKLQKSSPQAAQDFARKLGFDSAVTATIPTFSVPDESLDHLSEQAIQTAIAPLLDKKELSTEQKKSLEVVLTQLALGMGDKTLIDGQVPPTNQKSVDVAAYLTSLNENELYRLIYGQTADKKTEKAVLNFIKQHKEEIQNNLIDACRLVIAENGQKLGLSMAKGSVRLVREPGFDFPLTPKQALNRTFLVTQATGTDQERAGQVAAIAASEDRLSSAEQAYNQFIKQFQATYNSLDPVAQQILIQKAGLEPKDLEDLDGSYKFDISLMRAAGDLSKVLKDAQKAREAQEKITNLFQSTGVLNVSQQIELDRLLNRLYDIGLQAEADHYVEQLFGDENQKELVGQEVVGTVAADSRDRSEIVVEPTRAVVVEPDLSDQEILPEYEISDQDTQEIPSSGQGGISNFTRKAASRVRKYQKQRKAQKVAFDLAKKAGTKSATAALTAATGGAAAPIAGIQLLLDKRTRKPLLIGLIVGAGATVAALLGKLGATAGGVFGGLGVGAIGAIGGFIIGGPVGAVIGGLAGGTIGAGIGIWRGGGSPFGLGGGTSFPTPPAYYSPTASEFTPVASTTTLAPSQTMAGTGAGSTGLAEPIVGGPIKNASLSQSAINDAAGRFSPQPGGQWVDPSSGYRFDPNTGQVYDSAGRLVDPTGSTITPGATAAGATAGAVGIAAVIGPLGLSGAAFFMPAISVLSVMFITLITIITIFAAFISPMPVGTGYRSDPNSSANRYLELRKEVVPANVPNSALIGSAETTIQYSVTIIPKSGYQIKLSDNPAIEVIKDEMYSLPNPPTKPDIPTVWTPTWSTLTPYIEKSDFPEIIAQPATAQYSITFTEGEDALVMNEITIHYDVLNSAGEVIAEGEKFSDFAQFVIGNPNVLCWPTNGQITQLPGDTTYSHARLNAYDIARYQTTPSVYTPFAGTAVALKDRTGYGNYVRLEFDFGPYQNKVMIFGHLLDYDRIFGSPTSLNSPVSVSVGQRLGTMGSSGFSTGMHLHYELVGGLSNPFAPFLPIKPGGGSYQEGDLVRTCYPLGQSNP